MYGSDLLMKLIPKPLFIKRCKPSDFPKGSCWISLNDLGYRGLFGIQWGWLQCRLSMFDLNLKIKHPWYFKLSMSCTGLRHKHIYKDHKIIIKDRLTGKKKEVGYFA